MVDTPTPKRVTVEAITDHTFDGEPHEAGSTYEVEEQYVESLRRQRMALPPEEARAQREQQEQVEREQAARTKPR